MGDKRNTHKSSSDETRQIANERTLEQTPWTDAEKGCRPPTPTPSPSPTKDDSNSAGGE